MSPMQKDKYPDNWDEIAERRKAQEGYQCERCKVADSKNPKDGNCLTVHHLVPDTKLNEDWNLAALCQRCHLKMQHVNMFQEFMFEVSEWFQWHLEGFLRWRKRKKKAV